MDSQQTLQWSLLARQTKVYIIAAAALLVVVVSGILWDSWQVHSEIRKYEADAAEARREKDAALAQAANVASTIKIREEELNKVEDKKNAKAHEVESARTDVSRARAEYDHAVVSRRPDVPSTEQLCRELAAAGHPCYPTGP